jgi:hypothetical protein
MPLQDDLERALPAPLQGTVQSLLRQLDKAKASREELVEAVHRAAREAADALTIPPVPVPPKDRRRGKPEVAVAIISDWQLGKTTPTYDSDVCEERIQRFAAKIARLTAIQRADHPVRECHIWNLGDLLEGELIFPGQAHRIDASMFRQVSVDGPRILSGFQRAMLGIFDQVYEEDVDGNHGAIGGPSRRESHPETNLDRMLVENTRLILRGEKRFHSTDDEPRNERNWYAVDHIGNYSCLLIHGDQVRGGFAGFPWYGLGKKVGGWATSLPEHFDDVALGHFHTPMRVALNRITARCNGSTESDNTYALEQLASMGRPSQWLLFVEPEAGMVTAEYCVYLD